MNSRASRLGRGPRKIDLILSRSILQHRHRNSAIAGGLSGSSSEDLTSNEANESQLLTRTEAQASAPDGRDVDFGVDRNVDQRVDHEGDPKTTQTGGEEVGQDELPPVQATIRMEMCRSCEVQQPPASTVRKKGDGGQSGSLPDYEDRDMDVHSLELAHLPQMTWEQRVQSWHEVRHSHGPMEHDCGTEQGQECDLRSGGPLQAPVLPGGSTDGQ